MQYHERVMSAAESAARLVLGDISDQCVVLAIAAQSLAADLGLPLVELVSDNAHMWCETPSGLVIDLQKRLYYAPRPDDYNGAGILAESIAWQLLPYTPHTDEAPRKSK